MGPRAVQEAWPRAYGGTDSSAQTSRASIQGCRFRRSLSVGSTFRSIALAFSPPNIRHGAEVVPRQFSRHHLAAGQQETRHCSGRVDRRYRSRSRARERLVLTRRNGDRTSKIDEIFALVTEAGFRNSRSGLVAPIFGSAPRPTAPLGIVDRRPKRPALVRIGGASYTMSVQRIPHSVVGKVAGKR